MSGDRTLSALREEHGYLEPGLETRLELASVAIDAAMARVAEQFDDRIAPTVGLNELVARQMELLRKKHFERRHSLPDVSTAPGRVFARAAELIRERGWTQGVDEDETGALCLRAAVVTAAGGWDAPLTLVCLSLLLARIREDYPVGRLSVASWNDGPFGSRHGALRFLDDLS